ncbi:replication-associated recombination protein A [Alicyclobacillus acidocaldarius]|uniref:AAA ATPase central domain protein n=1 Tax=Alicyclobacillus acidocaldarius (strain Tc-4-1) TaxID=1048834 RepID=F8IF88_ALIAT|nr:replication-associated recombination protein A [Alicyclobacillus acidocaldarius]AEJ44053.1 AAA ATPase central domain protein [Alicyclobacillus acidocaldarius subsp. acidocaldarius Tc-4-1]
MDLFSLASEHEAEREAPLAYRMRPRSLDEMVGHQNLVGRDGILRRMIERDRLMSIILYGPPGTGKTAIAEVVARHTKARFIPLNAVTSGIADVRKAVEIAREERDLYGRRTVVFLDEIHRFNKSQQDALLPHVEAGLLSLVGATTENPYFDVNAALLSRSHVFRLEPLSPDDIGRLVDMAIADEERGLGRMRVRLHPDARRVLTLQARGDARRALNLLELAAFAARVGPDGATEIGMREVEVALEASGGPRYDRAGDDHYDTISAFIKSVRGSDVNAAMLWLAKMLEGGEDPAFIARRLMILAAEDVGMADPNALPIAVSGWQAAMAIGMPEARIVLAEVTAYLAKAPKSNSAYRAINLAMEDVRSGLPLEVPLHLRSTAYKGAKALGHGEGYLYPHDYPGHYVEQNYWPIGVEPRVYYREGDDDREDLDKGPLRPDASGRSRRTAE